VKAPPPINDIEIEDYQGAEFSQLLLYFSARLINSDFQCNAL